MATAYAPEETRASSCVRDKTFRASTCGLSMGFQTSSATGKLGLQFRSGEFWGWSKRQGMQGVWFTGFASICLRTPQRKYRTNNPLITLTGKSLFVSLGVLNSKP